MPGTSRAPEYRRRIMPLTAQVKPYPARCPYEGVEDFTTVDSLGLVPPPTSAEAAALQKLYARHFPRKPDAVLEAR